MGAPVLERIGQLLAGAPEAGGSAPFGARGRVGMLVELWRLERAGRPVVLLTGAGLARESGPLRFSVAPAEAGRAALLSGDPVRALGGHPDARAALARLSRLLGVEPRDELCAFVAHGDTLVALGERAGEPVAVHLAFDEAARAPLAQQAFVLGELAGEARALGLEGRVARALSFSRDDERARLIQTRLPGAAVAPERLSEPDLARRLELALEPLLRVHAAGVRAAPGPDAGLVERRLPLLLERFPEHHAALRPAVEALRDWSARRALPAVRVHGDYWLGNVLFDGAPPRVSGVVDWDRSRPRGLPGWDALHLGLMSVAEQRGASVGELLPRAWGAGRPLPVLDRYLARLPARLGLEPEALHHVALALWLGYLWNAHVEGLPADPRWLPRMVRAPAEAARAWLAERRTG